MQKHEKLRTRVRIAGETKVRVWAYRDRLLLPQGFESVHGRGLSPDTAWLDCLIKLCESVGMEVCLGTDEPGESNDAVWFANVDPPA